MRLLRRPGPLCAAAAVNLLVLSAVHLLYLDRLAGGTPGLDARFIGYSTEEVMSWLTTLGAAGREAMLVWHSYTLDLVFPMLFALAVASLIVKFARVSPRFLRLSAVEKSAFALAVVAPCLIADYAENVLIARMLGDPVKVSRSLVAAASACTIAKFTFGILAILFIAALYMAGRRKNARPTLQL